MHKQINLVLEYALIKNQLERTKMESEIVCFLIQIIIAKNDGQNFAKYYTISKILKYNLHKTTKIVKSLS